MGSWDLGELARATGATIHGEGLSVKGGVFGGGGEVGGAPRTASAQGTKETPELVAEAAFAALSRGQKESGAA